MGWRKARKGCTGQVKEKGAWWWEGEEGRSGRRHVGRGKKTDEEYRLMRRKGKEDDRVEEGEKEGN